jgi:Na+/H+ antiporter NhaD/arsenite permease-like protein
VVDLSCNHTVVALGKIPVYRIDRAGAAPLGGSLMVATGVLSLEEAYRAVDFNTNVLLLGMMIVGIKFLGLFQGGCATHGPDYCSWALWL